MNDQKLVVIHDASGGKKGYIFRTIILILQGLVELY